MSRFLVVFDRSHGRVMEVRQLDPMDRSSRARQDAEDEFKGTDDVEVVILTASSKDNLRRTHARYFDDFARLASQTFLGNS